MPNWCLNTVLFEGGRDDIMRVKAQFPQTFKFSDLVPLPSPSIDVAYRLWGTKWEPQDTFITVSGRTSYQIDFDTAWNPPLPWLLAVSRAFPDVQITINYSEPGFRLKGEARYYKGVVLYHEDQEIEDSEDENSNSSATA